MKFIKQPEFIKSKIKISEFQITDLGGGLFRLTSERPVFKQILNQSELAEVMSCVVVNVVDYEKDPGASNNSASSQKSEADVAVVKKTRIRRTKVEIEADKDLSQENNPDVAVPAVSVDSGTDSDGMEI